MNLKEGNTWATLVFLESFPDLYFLLLDRRNFKRLKYTREYFCPVALNVVKYFVPAMKVEPIKTQDQSIGHKAES